MDFPLRVLYSVAGPNQPNLLGERMYPMRIRLLTVLMSVALASTAAWADDVSGQGRKLFDQYKDAVVGVHVVLSMQMGGEENEDENWLHATVVDPSGVAVASLTQVDPAAFYQMISDGDEAPTSKVVSLKMILTDGTEIPAEVVLRDNDLDLAYLRPIAAPEAPMSYVDVKSGAKPEILDQVAVMVKLGEVSRRAHSVFIDRVEGVVEKPRPYYIVGEHRAQSIVSSPVFSLDGKLVGVGAIRAIKSENGPQMGESLLIIVVPTDDIAAGMEQIPPRG